MKALVFLLLLFSAQLTSNAQTTRIGDTCSGQYLEYTPLSNKAGYHVKEWYYDRLLFEGNCREMLQVKQFDSILEKEYPENEKYFYESLRQDKLKVKMNNYFLDSFVLYDGLDNIRKKYLIDGDGYITYIKMKNLEVSLSANLSSIYFSGINEEYRRRFRINGRKEQDTIFVTYATDNGKFTDTLLKQRTKYSKNLYRELNKKYYLWTSNYNTSSLDMRILKRNLNYFDFYFSFFEFRHGVPYRRVKFKNWSDYFEYETSDVRNQNFDYSTNYLYKKGKLIRLEEAKAEQPTYTEIVVPEVKKDCNFRDSIKMEDYRKGKIIKTCYDYVIPGTNKKFSDSDLVDISRDYQWWYGLKKLNGKWIAGPEEARYFEGENANHEKYFIKESGDFYKLYNCYGQDMYPNDKELGIVASNRIAIVNDSFTNTFKLNYLSSGLEIFGTGKIEYNPLEYRTEYGNFEITDYRTKQKGLIYFSSVYIPPLYSKIFLNRFMILGYNKVTQRLDMYSIQGEVKSNFGGVDSLGFDDISDEELITFKCDSGWFIYNLKNFKYCRLISKPNKTYTNYNIPHISHNGKITIYSEDFTRKLFADADSIVLTDSNFIAFKNNLAYFSNREGKIFDSIGNLQILKYWFINNRYHYEGEYAYKNLDGSEISDSSLFFINSFVFRKDRKYGLVSVEGKIIKEPVFDDIGLVFTIKNWGDRLVSGLYFIKNGIASYHSITDLQISEKMHHYGHSLINYKELFIGKTIQPNIKLSRKDPNELGKFHKIMNKEELASGEMMDYIGNLSFEKVGMNNVEYIENGHYYYTTINNKSGLKNCNYSTLFEADSLGNFRYDVQTNTVAVHIRSNSFKLYSLKTQKYFPDTFNVPPIIKSQNGTGIVVRKNKYGLINANGVYIVEPNYSWIIYSAGNYAYILGYEKTYYFYFEKLKKLVATSYEHIQPLYNSGFIAYRDLFVYILDSMGTVIDSSNSFFYNSKNMFIKKLVERNINIWEYKEMVYNFSVALWDIGNNNIDSNLLKLCAIFPKNTYFSNSGHMRFYPDVVDYNSIDIYTPWRGDCADINENSELAATKTTVCDFSKQISNCNFLAPFKLGFSVVSNIPQISWSWVNERKYRIYFLTDSGLLHLHCANLIAPNMRETLENWLLYNWNKLEKQYLPIINRDTFFNYIMNRTFFIGDKVIFYKIYKGCISMSLSEFNKYLKPEWKGKFN